MATVVLVGTLDTKGREFDYLRDRLREQDVDVILVDAGAYEPQAQADVSSPGVDAAAAAWEETGVHHDQAIDPNGVPTQTFDLCPIEPGDTIYVALAQFHSTVNKGWGPMRLLALYNPGGAEKALSGLPDFQEVSAGSLPDWTRS
jgi:hypothetical protein